MADASTWCGCFAFWPRAEASSSVIRQIFHPTPWMQHAWSVLDEREAVTAASGLTDDDTFTLRVTVIGGKRALMTTR